MRRWSWLLVLAPVPLFTTGALHHVPTTLMAVLGLGALVRHWRDLRDDRGARLVLAVFLGLWAPQVLALPDAVDVAFSAQTAAIYIALPLMAVHMIRALADDRQWLLLSTGLSVIVGLWAVDVVLPALGLVEWPGRPDHDRMLDGAYFGRHTLGYLAAVIAPFVLEISRRYGDRRWLAWLVPVALCAVVIVSGKRWGWVMLILGGAGFGTYLARVWGVRSARIAGAATLVGLLAVFLYSQHEGTRERVELSLGVLSTDVEEIDTAISWRLDIWRNAAVVASDHWVNGIGTRGFRDVYGAYAPTDDFWMQDGLTGALHPHFFALEVAAETGLIGLLGYGFALWAILTSLSRIPADRPWVRPLGIAAVVAHLPINVHTALYSEWWSGTSWWLLGLLAASVSRLGQPCTATDGSLRSHPGSPPDV